MDFQDYIICGETVTIPIPRSYKDCAELIRSDSYRHNGKRKSLLSIWLSGFTRTSMGFSFWWRLSQHRGWLFPLTKLMMHRYKKYGLLIPDRVRAGYGLYIQHCAGTVINRSAVIGNNVSLGQFTTIGANSPEGAALIGDNVYIGSGTSIVDHVEIGCGACIGAGAVVTRRVDPATTVAGVPARKIADKGHPEYTRHPWPIKSGRQNTDRR